MPELPGTLLPLSGVPVDIPICRPAGIVFAPLVPMPGVEVHAGAVFVPEFGTVLGPGIAADAPLPGVFQAGPVCTLLLGTGAVFCA
ncbi:MAG TPA: hypothetical protein VFA18_00510 [Gemmataceae bacterium]|nr:hypothetical protein [Gemmataceae bacterium]